MASTNPVFYRNPGAKGGVVFVHGFTGEAAETWDGFPNLLKKNEKLADYEFCFWGYPTELKLRYAITRYFWEDDPDIDTIGQGLRTLLENAANQYEKLVLVGHSMGGLVIQAFILEEIRRGKRSKHLDRLTEVVLYATPSGGLRKASWGAFLKSQIADMGDYGPFIEKLRSGWKQMVDDRRSDPNREAQFRLTLVAGMKDRFVPPETALDPFPLDEKEIAPGNHTEVVKPAVVGETPYLILTNRLLRPALTASQRKLVNGESEETVQYVNRIRAAADLGDVEALKDLATSLDQQGPLLPRVDRALGLALLGQEQYQQAAALLTRYLEFRMPDDQSQPFRHDGQAVQQLAIALSGAGRITEAVTWLNELPIQIREDPETQGILAGRFKRQWLKSQSSSPIGWQTFNLYQAAFEKAKPTFKDLAFYNGINAAYMNFALSGKDYADLAREVLSICKAKENPDYWTEATRAEAHLLLCEYGDAEEAYYAARRRKHEPRQWSSTGQQALDIIQRQGNPQDSAKIAALFKSIPELERA